MRSTLTAPSYPIKRSTSCFFDRRRSLGLHGAAQKRRSGLRVDDAARRSEIAGVVIDEQDYVERRLRSAEDFGEWMEGQYEFMRAMAIGGWSVAFDALVYALYLSGKVFIGTEW